MSAAAASGPIPFIPSESLSGVVRIEPSPSLRPSAARELRGEPAVVVECLPNRMLSVETRDGQRLAVHASGAMRVAVVRLVVGDAVRIERSPFDGGKGRIVGIDRGYPARVRTAPNEHRQPQIDRVEIQP